MLVRLIAVAMALDIASTCIEGVYAPASAFLPIGHSHAAQLGVLLGAAVGIYHFWQAINNWPSHKDET